MLRIIDNFLNSITMYKVVLYGLLFIALIAIVLGAVGILPYNPVALITSLIVLTVVCFGSNLLFAKIFKAPQNAESWIITALILFFLMAPITNVEDALALVLSAVLAMASKFFLAIKKKHIFNPAAISVFILGVMGSSSVFWWVGSVELLPFVAIVGLLIVRKIRRFKLLFSFLATSLITIVFMGFSINQSILESLKEAFISWPLVFFGTVMLTEPLTTPPTKYKQMIYGGLVGLLFGSKFQFGPIFSTPELALIIGNIYSYIVSPKQKLFLKMKDIVKLGPDIYEFIFTPNQKLNFSAGQYLEWTLPHQNMDLRGNRRYFTIASSPTEEDIKLGVKVTQENSSSFKKALLNMKKGQDLVASQLVGDFTLPSNADQKLVFIAGGIGVTPFRSILKFLMDTNQKRDIVMFYSSLTPESLVYRDLFDKAVKSLGIKVFYVLTDPKTAPKGWLGKIGYITEEMLKKEVPDFKERKFYLSGPIAMVNSYKKLLSNLNIPNINIVTDYFPGF